MNQFFKGGKRKVGLVCLLLACSLTFFWFRSLFVYHVMNVPIGPDRFFQIGSAGQQVTLASLSLSRQEDRSQSRVARWHTEKSWGPGFAKGPIVCLVIGNSTGSVGLTSSDKAFTTPVDMSVTNPTGAYQMTGACRSIPYWMIVLPFTLLSVLFLLASIKPRSSEDTGYKPLSSGAKNLF